LYSLTHSPLSRPCGSTSLLLLVISFNGHGQQALGFHGKDRFRYLVVTVILQWLPLTSALIGFFRLVQTCVLVDVNQPLPWFFTRWPRADSFPVSRAIGRTCPRLSRFCNILLQDPAQFHVKITRNTNLLSVCRRKLKLSPYTHCKLQPHKLSQCRLAARLSS